MGVKDEDAVNCVTDRPERGKRCWAGHSGPGESSRLFVRRVLPTTTAVLLQFQAVAGVGLVLVGHVIPLLALFASECDGGPFV